MTKQADYAVRIVEYLSCKKEKCGATQIAEKLQIPQRFCLKILRDLVLGEMVVSYKGVKGGYALAKQPREITLLQVIELVDGPYMISRCQDSSYRCERYPCRLHRIYEKTTKAIRDELNAYNFEMISCGRQES